MPYNKNELMQLPAAEKQELAEALWNSLENEALPPSAWEEEFANERMQMHEEAPDEGIEWHVLKEKIKAKYGF